MDIHIDQLRAGDDPECLRGEILTEDHLAERAVALGRAHVDAASNCSARPLRRRFRQTRKLIQIAYATLAEGAERQRDPSPAEMWLLDNSHIVEGQLREIDEDLPWGYLVKLPRMGRGRMRGYPLVYALCLEYLRHTDCHVDFRSLSRFVDAYQTERVLTIGELWAVPIMLRLGLVLAVSALAVSEANADDRDLAESWARRLLPQLSARPGRADDPAIEQGRKAALMELRQFGDLRTPSDALLVTLLKRLREREDAPGEALDWIAEQTARLDTTPEELARRHHLRQAADQVSVGNAITSMRSINSLDWSVFFAATSHVEAILLQDPSGAYPTMDDPSRDRYRHCVERMARRSPCSETEVAQRALSMASAAAASSREAHIGYYLVDAGKRSLREKIEYRPGVVGRVGGFIADHPSACYLGAMGALTVLITAGVLLHHFRFAPSGWLQLLLVPLLLLAISEIAVAVVNTLVVTFVAPRLLPKLEFRHGIPDEHRTLVVVPTLLTDSEALGQLLEELEVRSLANADDNLHFALLTDFPDSDRPEQDGEAELLSKAVAAVERLNAGRLEPRFFLLHRRRLLNPTERDERRRYLGWERKRGKLAELNRLLRGATDTSFQIVTAPRKLLARVRYVITLDTDTDLPLGVARRLVGALAHPLNRPVVDPRTRRVVRGHAIIQPRVGTSPTSARRSIFSRLAAGPPGIDPYTTAVSDVYQDLFGEGSFVGKGIYDVDAFAQVMTGRVPENQVLSHDLFESIYARAALASDIEVLDEQPAAYSVAAGRQHRWIRGDWQLLPWLRARVPDEKGTRRFDFRPFDTWRVLDNLRRSLLAPALVVLGVITWLSGPSVALAGTALIASVFVVPVLGRLAFAFARSDAQLEWLGGLGGDLKSNAQQALLSLVFLLDQALVAIDAIVRSIYRQGISRQKLLEWTSMRDASRAREDSVLRVPRLLLASALAVIIAAGVVVLSPEALVAAAPVLMFWVVAPWIALFISSVQPVAVAEPWGAAEVRTFRRIARKTWRFFERFVDAGDNYLPPDNFQEDPRGVVAHRTSPTNIGLYLLAVGSARDLGFITLGDAMSRWADTLGTMERMEKREGHILNWYDTTTLVPLEPRYVSTVDSGNLAGYLWTLAQTCREAQTTPLISAHTLEAAQDAVNLAREAIGSSSWASAALGVCDELDGALTRGIRECTSEPASLTRVLRQASDAVQRAMAEARREGWDPETNHWLDTAKRTLDHGLRTLEQYLPYLRSLDGLRSALGDALDAEHSADLRRLEDLARATVSVRDVVRSSDELRTLARRLAVQQGARRDAQLEHALNEFDEDIERAAAEARNTIVMLDELSARADELVARMDFSFLYDEERSLFSIGYNVGAGRLDNSHYDLLASEARLASLVAIAKGDVPQKHWFRLGRLRAKYASAPGLLSWSGSMFEYLMPLLVTRSFADTLLDQTYHAAIERHMKHAARFGVPWGVSEAAYNVMDLGMNYQYRAFGVPELGLKPGLGEDLVISPYATALAALVRARAAAKNFTELSRIGLDGDYGYYEAIDFTPSRLPPGRQSVVVKAFMAHHQGMTLVAMSNLLTDFAMQRRFHADARVKACALLLEERIPARAGVVQPETPRAAPRLSTGAEHEITAHLDLDQMRHGQLRGHLLGFGDLSTWVTTAGEGFMSWRGFDVVRFREDAAASAGGIYIYVRNLDEGTLWSGGYLPTLAEPNHYDVVFSIDKIELQRRDGDIETSTEIVLSPEHAAEIRRITLTNHGQTTAQLDLSSFSELCLAPRSADIAHPAFQKLFVETEYHEPHQALIAHRRKRSEHEAEVWVGQMLIGSGSPESPLEFCTSREEFLGREGSLAEPIAMAKHWKLSAASGGALDPALVLRRRVALAPGEQVRSSLVTLVAESRTALLDLIELYAAPHSIPRAFDLAWADARVGLRHLNISSSKAHRYQRLLSAVIHPQAALRGTGYPPSGARGRDALWSQGISGDLPIVVLRLDEVDFSNLCRDLLLAHEYWRLNGVQSDLLILNEEAPGYLQPVQDVVLSLIRSTPAEGHVDQRGGVFLRRTALIPEEDLQLLLTAARAVLYASRGSLAKQLRALNLGERPRRIPAASSNESEQQRAPRPQALPTVQKIAPRMNRERLMFDNGIGGFSARDGAYVMDIGPGRRPPQPWSNVMAGPRFGALVTEAGSSFTWYDNSQKNRLTPWSNDPTQDPSGELFFVRDSGQDQCWSLTPAPAGGDVGYLVRHAQGHSSFEHTRNELFQRLTVSVSPDDAVKVWHVSIRNQATHAKTVSVYGFVEWVLGNHRETLRVSTTTSYLPELNAIVARNPFGPLPKSRAFFAATETPHSYSGDREEFLGRSCTRARPAAVGSQALSGNVGTGLDPCAALELRLTLQAGEERNLAFVLGAGEDEREALALLARYSRLDDASYVLESATAAFGDVLDQVRVKTPDAAFDLLTNHWLLYQVLSCRFWGRSGFFQSGGAYGFRDQLQDSLALVHARPDLTRAHILASAARQFLEGDVQHWWHADTGEGVRTQCSDDLIWLPWATLEYAASTGDQSIWDAQVPFLQERLLEAGEDDLYSVPAASAESGSIYEHCVRALQAANTRGPHGLPLMRAGDWNDGMNRVGLQGRGESVWLAWFLGAVLTRFAELADDRSDGQRATWCRAEAKRLGSSVDEAAWDGAWYRRAFFDGGEALGSQSSVECRIDAIAQSWAVLSGLGRPERARQALGSSLEQLWDRDEKMLLLLTPPFEGRGPDPGYIAAYPPGIRENGGQYTHGILWTALALLEQGRGDEGHELLAMLNPIHHTTESADLAKYQVEPYVVAADVYSCEPHVGRGGWTWYTGSAAWMYRIGVEGLLGVRRRGDELHISPCVPSTWTHFQVEYRLPGGGRLEIVFENPARVSRGVERMLLDGDPVVGDRVRIPNDAADHRLLVTLGPTRKATNRAPSSAESGQPRRVGGDAARLSAESGAQDAERPQ